MNSRKAERGTPARSASTVISDRHWMTTPSITLWQILQVRARSPSPTQVTPDGAIASSSARTSSNTSFGPDETMVSFLALTTLPLPLTGAARNCAPRSASARRTSSDAASSTEEQSTTMRGAAAGSDSSPSGPEITARKSSGPATMANTTSRSARSAGAATIFAP